MTRNAPRAGTPVATGIATGSLGTGTAVDDETTLMAVPDLPESTEQPQATAPRAAAAPVPAAKPVQASAPMTERRSTSRRDPYRPIGIALAAILVALAGFAALSSGGDSPIDAGAAPAASQTPVPGASGDQDGDTGGEQDDGDAGGPKGNCNGRGNDPCDRDGDDGD